MRKELEDMVANGDGILNFGTQAEIKDLIAKTFDRRIPIEQTIMQLRKKKEEVTHGNGSKSGY